ncbi:MAG TPA: IS1595 family transposase [Rhizomicrobium sp.]|jgi:transposase-like protein
MAKGKRIHQMTVGQWEAAFPTDDACKSYLAANRWPEGVVCPRCGNPEVGEHGTRAFNWQCYACSEKGTSYRFSVLVGTIFENTKYPLRSWFRVIHMMLTSKKGVSALQVHRVIGTGSYETAWSMCHRIRAGLAKEDFRKLIGIVEVDETLIGGDAANRHKDKRGGGKGGGSGRGAKGKSIVVGAVQRKGNVVARVIDNVSSRALTSFIREAVSTKVSVVCTDSFKGYTNVGAIVPHSTVDHSKGEYLRYDDEVVGAIHANTIEGFWSLIKRGVVGTFHKVSKKYLPLYVAEFQFRYNNRLNDDIFGEAIRGC